MDGLDDLDLEALMGELEAVQEEQTGNRLAERSCIEIMMKLMQSDQLEVLYTLDGREYLTPAQLKRELEAEIERQGGRVHLGEMQQVLNVDRFYIDAAARALVAASKETDSSSLQLINEGTELIGDLFLDNMACEVTEYLEDAGSVSIGELATNHGFPVDFVQKMVETRLASGKLQASYRRGKLYSEEFAHRLERRILGALTAVTCPTSLHSLAQRLDLLDRSVVVDTAKKLCQSGRIRGTVSDDEFFPEIFCRIQRETCFEFFHSNGWMPKSRALQLKVSRLAPLLAEKLGADAVLDLPSCVVPTSLFEVLQSLIEEVILSGTMAAGTAGKAGASSNNGPSEPGSSWFHVATALEPITLTNADISALFKKMDRKDIAVDVEDMKKASRAVLVDHAYVVSTSFFSECRVAFNEFAEAYAEEAVAMRLQIPTGQRTGVSAEGEEYHIVGGEGRNELRKEKHKGKNKRNQRGDRPGDNGNSSDDESTLMPSKVKGKSVKKGRRKKGRRRGAELSGDEEDIVPAAAASSKGTRRAKKNSKYGGSGGADRNAGQSGDETLISSARDVVTATFLNRILREKFKHLNVDPEGNEDSEDNNVELVDAIVAHIEKHVRDVYVEAMKKALARTHKSSAMNAQVIATGLLERLIASHQQLVMDTKALERFLAVATKQIRTPVAETSKGTSDGISSGDSDNDKDDKDESKDEEDEGKEEMTHAPASELCQVISKYIIETHGRPIIGMFLGAKCPHESIALAKNEENDSENIDKVIAYLSDPATAQKIINKIDDKETRQSIASLINLTKHEISTETVSKFVQLVESVAAACNMILRPLDKKSERNVVFHKTNMISDQLAATNDPIRGSVNAGVLLFSRLEGTFLHIPASCPTKHCASLLLALVPLVSPSLGRLLTTSAQLLSGGGEVAAADVLKSLQILSKTKRSQLKDLEVDGM